MVAGLALQRSDRARTVEERKTRPAMAWAVIGAMFVGLQLYVFASWLASGNAKRTPTGPDPVPTWMTVSVRAWEVLMVGTLLCLIFFVVIRPWRRTGRPTFDGLFVLALLSIYWQDPFVNFTQTWFTYNSAFINFGSWGPNVPSWIAPHGNFLPEPILGIAPNYGVSLLACMLGNAVMRRAKLRWPRLGKFGLIAVAFTFFALFDFVLEGLVMLRFGLIAYPGSIGALTIFHGHYYQFPVYEALFAGAFWGGFACVRYFRNDRGESVAERGIDEIALSSRWKNGVRFLALAGLCNAIFLAVNIGYAVPALHAERWPDDVVGRSYLTDGFCGPGTNYACSGPRVPVPRRGSARVGPNGELVPADRSR